MNPTKLDMYDRKNRVAIMLSKNLINNDTVFEKNLNFYQKNMRSSKRLQRICKEFDIPIDNFIYK